MHTITRQGYSDIRKLEDVKFMVSSKGCMGCVDTGTDIMFAVDTTPVGTTDTKITQIFMTNDETVELLKLLTAGLKRNYDD